MPLNKLHQAFLNNSFREAKEILEDDGNDLSSLLEERDNSNNYIPLHYLAENCPDTMTDSFAFAAILAVKRNPLSLNARTYFGRKPLSLCHRPDGVDRGKAPKEIRELMKLSEYEVDCMSPNAILRRCFPKIWERFAVHHAVSNCFFYAKFDMINPTANRTEIEGGTELSECVQQIYEKMICRGGFDGIMFEILSFLEDKWVE